MNELGLAEPMMRVLRQRKITSPTPIQAQAIPVLLDGHDVVGIAQTGTGKTAAFVLPILQQISQAPARAKAKHCRALILAPTRELAAQIMDQVRHFSRYMKISSTLIVGGAKYPPQIKSLARGVDIVVATPGRLIDHMESGNIQLPGTSTLVLDEADQMFDMGFLPPIKQILKACGSNRQTTLMSATMPKPIRALCQEFLHDPVEISVAAQAQPIETIEQQVRHVPAASKLDVLLEILGDANMQRGIVFTRTKHGADRLAKKLVQAELSADALHGDKNQRQRERILAAFKKGKIRILIATDVAARGIHVDGVSHVINYDVPTMAEAYVHRIGRTARAGQSGCAISLCDAAELPALRSIERLIKAKIPVHGPEPVQEQKSAKPRKPQRRRPQPARPRGAAKPGPNHASRPRKARTSKANARKQIQAAA